MHSFEIESNTFYGCKALTNCEIPSTVKKIGDYAFKDCIALKEIKLHSIDSIGNNAFQGCSSLSSLELPPTIKKIGYYAFDKCPLTKIRIPSSASVGDDSIIYERYDP